MLVVDSFSGDYTVILGNVTEIWDPRELTISHQDSLSSAFSPQTVSFAANDMPQAVRMANILAGLLAPAMSQDHRVAQYSKRYRLAFTLLNENAVSTQLVCDWDIRAALAGKRSHSVYVDDDSFFVEHISPLLMRLSSLHEFVIESQIQFHAPLAFEPSQVVVSNNTLYGLTPADLSVFVNSAEWTLCDSSETGGLRLKFLTLIFQLRAFPMIRCFILFCSYPLPLASHFIS